ncbi:hypothetical protein MLC59_05290 [Marinobacter bryozoorum]|uniref:hypothetical protein n=1 Tax=Marinobacter bryozoorum TaxID=256324 RepID=UPI00200615B0|nr:hypothetical protein [Marinobacter bryozoorum]MCK7543578.1 hypothetical protein [Marinobacter bryozoorum]
MKILMTVSIMFLASAFSQAGERDIEHRYLAEKIADYGSAIERCEEKASSRDLPPSEVMDKLASLEPDMARGFLITSSAMAQRACEKPELTELAYTIGRLEGVDLSDKARAIIENTRPLIFGPGSWELERKYIELPESVKTDLMATGYFDEPFDDRRILRELD